MLTFLSILFLSAFSIEAASLTKRDPAKSVKGLGKAKSVRNPKKSCDGQTFMMVNYKTTLSNNPKFKPESPDVEYKYSPINDKATYYILQSGDYFWKIAEEFAPTSDTSKAVEDIAKLNGIQNANEILTGQPLRFPEYFTIPEIDERFQVLGLASEKSYYMVQQGDWLAKIVTLLAPHKGSSTAVNGFVAELALINGIDDSYSISVGQLLVLPTGFARLSNGKTFVELASCSK